MLAKVTKHGRYSLRQGWYRITLSHFQATLHMITDLQTETITL